MTWHACTFKVRSVEMWHPLTEETTMDNNHPKPKSMFPSFTKYTGNVKDGPKLTQKSTTATTIGRAKGSNNSVSGHTANGLVRRSAPPKSISKAGRN